MTSLYLIDSHKQLSLNTVCYDHIIMTVSAYLSSTTNASHPVIVKYAAIAKCLYSQICRNRSIILGLLLHVNNQVTCDLVMSAQHHTHLIYPLQHFLFDLTLHLLVLVAVTAEVAESHLALLATPVHVRDVNSVLADLYAALQLFAIEVYRLLEVHCAERITDGHIAYSSQLLCCHPS